MLRYLVVLLFIAAPASAQEKIIAGLSQNIVSITATFFGSEILVFGAVKREMPAPDTGPLHVVIAVSGPSTPVVVRRKERAYGIWVNKDAVGVDSAPSFYTVAATGELSDVISATEDLRYKIGIENKIVSIDAPAHILDAQLFSEAVVRIRQDQGLYSVRPSSVELTDETLFRSQIALPSNIVEGDYQTRIFLTRGGEVVDEYVTTITVRKVGMERWIYNLAHQRPLVYGILSLFIAIAAGWTASAVFRMLRL